MSTFGTKTIVAPHTVTTIDASLSADYSEIIGCPQRVRVYADGGDIEILFTGDTTAVVAGNGWIIKSGDYQDFIVSENLRFLQVVVGGTARYFKG